MVRRDCVSSRGHVERRLEEARLYVDGEARALKLDTTGANDLKGATSANAPPPTVPRPGGDQNNAKNDSLRKRSGLQRIEQAKNDGRCYREQDCTAEKEAGI